MPRQAIELRTLSAIMTILPLIDLKLVTDGGLRNTPIFHENIALVDREVTVI